jgi:hypothetical protein
MFESQQQLRQQIIELLQALRAVAGGRYACVVDARGIVFESEEPEDRESWALRRLVEERRADLLRIPARLSGDEPMEDLFEDWTHDELFLAFLNQRVAVVIACPEAEPLKQDARKPLEALADRLFRYDQSWRLSPKGGGFFFGRAQLDMVVIGRAHG